MKKKSITRNYSFTDAVLILKAKEKVAFMKRDAEAFASFGITITNILALENKLNDFSALETDIEIKGNQTEITAAKKAKAEELIEAIKTLMTIVSLRFKKNTPQYIHFGTADITHQKESQLYTTAAVVLKMTDRYLTELAPFGLTNAHLDNITALNEHYAALLIEQQIAMPERQIHREKRITIGNAIYKTLQQYASVGLAHWETRSAAKHNDYLLYSGRGIRKLRIA